MAELSTTTKATAIQPRIATFLASDGYRFYVRRWDTASRPHARVVFLHGIRSHGGWYLSSCSELAGAGYDVHFLDRRGSGLNSAYRGHTPSFRRLLDDVAEYLQELRRERAWLPTVLAGISWGGKLAAAVPYRRPGLIQGLVLITPGLVPIIQPAFSQRLRMAVAGLIQPPRRFPIPLNEPELFTSDPAWQDYIDKDRYGLRQATARFFLASAMLDIYLRRATRQIDRPVLLLLAGRDRIINNTGTREYLRRCSQANVTVCEYVEADHTLEFSQNAGDFCRDIRIWLEKL